MQEGSREKARAARHVVWGNSMTINDAEGRARKKARDLEAIELVGIIGFALFFAWMFDCFY